MFAEFSSTGITLFALRVMASPPASDLGSPAIKMLTSLALILLSLFVALNSYRVPNPARQRDVLQSVAGRFRLARGDVLSIDTQVFRPGSRNIEFEEELLATMQMLFSGDGSLSPEGISSLKEIATQLKKRPAVIEVLSYAAPGADPVTALYEAERKGTRIYDFLRENKVSSYALSLKSQLGKEAGLTLRIHHPHGRYSWR